MKAKRVFGLLILIGGLALCVKGLWLLLVPSWYEAMVKIEIQQDVVSDVPSGYQPYDPYFMETELKAMEGDMVLSNVVQTLNLDVKWGNRDGRQLGTSDAIEMLRQSLTLDAVQNTRIVEITVRDKDPEEAAQIANTIADSYGNYRIDQHRQQMEAGIEKLEENYQVEETNLFIMQSNVERLRKKYGIRDTDPNSTTPGPTIATERLQHLNELLIETQANDTRLENQFARFHAIQETNPATLSEVLITVFPDTVLSDLLGKLQANERQLVELKNFHGTNNVEVESALAVNAKVKEQIKDRVTGIMIGLAANIQAQKDEVDALKQQISKVEVDRGAEEIRSEPYWEAKRRWKDAKDLHQMLAAKIEFEQGDVLTPKNVLVVVIERAVPPKVPATANHWQGGIWLLCGLVLAGPGFFMLRSPKPQGQ